MCQYIKTKNKVFDTNKFSLLLIITVTVLCSDVFAAVYDTSHFYGGEVSQERKNELNNLVRLSPVQPADTHPRLYGTNEQWYATIERYEALDENCNWLGQKGQGTIKNIKKDWDEFTLGGQTCGVRKQALPSSIEEYTIANQYLTNSIEHWNRNKALRIVHLIRRMNYCHEISQSCQYSQEEITRLSKAFLAYEFNRLRTAPRNASGYIASWHKGYQGKFFDLGAYPAFKLWTLILDTFWNSDLLSLTQRQYIFDELEVEIDSYIELYNLPEGANSALGRWAIHNGNNWTPILNAAATFWAITFWHEDGYKNKARNVMDIVLKSGWLHRDNILDDGAYVEGPSYLNVSLNGSLEINRLLQASFGQPNHAMKWGLMGEKTSVWMLDNIASDGRFIDFGDSWAKNGYENMYFMDLLYWEEAVGLADHGSINADACLLENYFATSYYSHVFYDPWGVPDHYARNFYDLVHQCQHHHSSTKTLIYSDYQIGTLRSYLPGATKTAEDITDSKIRNQMADQTFLAGNAVDNFLSHRELDFGAVIWSAYGSRLLSDWGYGELSNSYDFYKIKGAKGRYIASNYGVLSLSLKHVSGSVDTSRFYINLKLKGVTKRLTLSDYISKLINNWTTVLIPLADFGLNDSDWQGLGNGLEYISLTSNGFIKNGEFGIDEIKFLDAAGNDAFVWYGDSHSESLESTIYATTPYATTPQLSKPSALHISRIETEGGAHGTAGWVTFYSNGSYGKADIFYSENPDDFHVKNYMDYLPIGANTLVIPNAQDSASETPQRTHKSQLKGHAGKLHSLDISGKSALHFNGSRVYGRDLNTGYLDYFHRYLIPLSDGNQVIVDSFKTKAGYEDKVQEFWYSYKDNDKTCGEKIQDVLQTIDDGALLLTPRCNALQANENVESYGRIIAASLEPGAFTLGAPEFMTNNLFFNRFVEGNGLYMINRLANKEQRRLARYVPDSKVLEDVRVFLLQASTSTNYAHATVEKINCGDDVCFNVDVVGGDHLHLVLHKTEGQYVFAGTDLTLPPATDDTDSTPTYPNSVLLAPFSLSASHPNRVGQPEKLFDEQTNTSIKPINGEATPEFRHSKPYVNFSSASTALPLKQSVATDSQYGRAIYVDETGAPLSATFTIELAALSSLTEIFYYDMSSLYRQGQLIVEVSTDGQTWSQIHDDMTGEYRQWVSIDVGHVDAKYIRFEFPEENSAKGITEVMIYGDIIQEQE